VRSLSIALKSLLLLALAAALPAAVAKIFFGRVGAIVAAAIAMSWVAVLAVRAESLLDRLLRPRPIRIGRFSAREIEDPSSHAFATRGLLAKEPALWITRGALTLLPSTELESLLEGMSRAAERGGLRFETVLTSWIMRVTLRMPASLRNVVFYRHLQTTAVPIREAVRGAVWLSMALLLDRFYFRASLGDRGVPEPVLRKLEAESRRCVPRLPPALAGHSAVAPWPNALVTLGRPCLLPPRAVDLRA
jgi:hypothetical protein